MLVQEFQPHSIWSFVFCMRCMLERHDPDLAAFRFRRRRLTLRDGIEAYNNTELKSMYKKKLELRLELEHHLMHPSGEDKISSGRSILALYGVYTWLHLIICLHRSRLNMKKDLAFNYIIKWFVCFLYRIKFLEIHAQCYTRRCLGSIVCHISTGLRSNSSDSDTTKNFL